MENNKTGRRALGWGALYLGMLAGALLVAGLLSFFFAGKDGNGQQ